MLCRTSSTLTRFTTLGLMKREFRNGVNWGTTYNSSMERLDGSLLAQYHGSPAIEASLKIFIEKRRIEGFDLLDSGVAQEQSFYVTQALELPVPMPQDTLVSSASAMYQRHVSKTAAPGSTSPSITTSEPIEAQISILACVLYLLLVEPKDVSTDWEIGAVQSNGQMIKIKRYVNC